MSLANDPKHISNSEYLVQKNVARFVSSLAAAYRSFYLYQQNNRAFEEILINLARRFQESFATSKPIKLTITNRSFVFEGQPSGLKDITMFLAAQLRSLGYKEIIFQSPIQNRNFFQLLHILSSKDPDDQKMEKLLPLLADGQIKPISLVPINANTSIMRLSDQLIMQRLTPLSIPVNMEGTGFLEKLAEYNFENISDLLNWICIRADMFPNDVKLFTRNLADATREGYFPFERFLRVFPLPRRIRDDFKRKMDPAPDSRRRKSTLLGHHFSKEGRKGPIPPKDWTSQMLMFTELEGKMLQTIRSQGTSLSAAQDLDLAKNLLGEEGPDFILGLCLLLRYTNDTNPVAIQEKALRIALEVWNKHQSEAHDPTMTSLLTSLRQSLTAPHNLILCLDPLRNATIDSWEFKNLMRLITSLGKAVLPGLVSALEAEPDRGMRKKICQLLTDVSSQFGIEPLVTALPSASPFLLRNLVMILGDIRNPLTIPDLTPLLKNSSKIVRIEAIRALCKMGTDESNRTLLALIEQNVDQESKQWILDYLVATRHPNALDLCLRLAKQPSVSGAWRRSLYKAIATLGGPKTRLFFEQIQKESSFMSRFNPDQIEDMDLIKQLLAQMPGS